MLLYPPPFRAFGRRRRWRWHSHLAGRSLSPRRLHFVPAGYEAAAKMTRREMQCDSSSSSYAGRKGKGGGGLVFEDCVCECVCVGRRSHLLVCLMMHLSPSTKKFGMGSQRQGTGQHMSLYMPYEKEEEPLNNSVAERRE